jgi:hypothetical protein
MFNKKLFIRLSSAIVLATAAFCAYHYYQSSYRIAYIVSPIDAPAFYSEFVSNPTEAITKYNNQPIKIRGIVADRNKSEGAIVINLETGNSSEGVECELDASFPYEKVTFEAGDEVIFKGICVGTVENEVRIVNCVVE